MEFETDPIGPDRVVRGAHLHRRLPEAVLRRLMLAGVPVPPQFSGDESDEAAVVRSAGE